MGVFSWTVFVSEGKHKPSLVSLLSLAVKGPDSSHYLNANTSGGKDGPVWSCLEPNHDGIDAGLL